MSLRTAVCLALLSLVTACNNLDIGAACQVSECDVNNPPDNANTVCEPAVGCRTLLCVGQGQGLGTGNVAEFCSVDCVSDDDCKSDEGVFTCQEVATVGQNANRKVCLQPAQ